MEIYKLKDFKSGDSDDVFDGGSDGLNDGGSHHRITNIKQGVKNQNRVNVFVDGKYSFSLDISQVVDLKLKVGKVISDSELAEYRKASEFGKLYQRTLEWVLSRPHSIRETRDYLFRKTRSFSKGALRGASPSLTPSERHSSFSKKDVGMSSLSNEIIERLIQKGYLDDYKFAEYYVENRFTKKGISKKRLALELTKKGISRDIIEQVLEETGRNDEEEILKIIAKKRAKYDDEKLIQYLCRQGFPFETSRNLVQTYETDSRNSE